MTTENRPFYFEEIDESEVSSKILEKAKRVLDYCQKMLGLSGIEIRWIRATSPLEGGLEILDHMLARLAGDASGDKPKAQRDPDGDFLGRVFSKRGDRIFMIRSDVPLREVLLTVAHEADHERCHQIYRPPWTVEEKLAWEEHAEAFAREVLKEIGE